MLEATLSETDDEATGAGVATDVLSAVAVSAAGVTTLAAVVD